MLGDSPGNGVRVGCSRKNGAVHARREHGRPRSDGPAGQCEIAPRAQSRAFNQTLKVLLDIVEIGKAFCLTLVYPRDLDGNADKLSILAPVGSALLGLAVRDALAWPGPGGKAMTVQVKHIVYQPESAGELHR